jgi:hypothetical protein
LANGRDVVGADVAPVGEIARLKPARGEKRGRRAWVGQQDLSATACEISMAPRASIHCLAAYVARRSGFVGLDGANRRWMAHPPETNALPANPYDPRAWPGLETALTRLDAGGRRWTPLDAAGRRW